MEITCFKLRVYNHIQYIKMYNIVIVVIRYLIAVNITKS